MALTCHEPNLAGACSNFSSTLLLILLVGALLCGCAAPGVPVTRGTTKPQRITDLSAQQVGNSIELSFTLPTETSKGIALSSAPQIEIYRAFAKLPAPSRAHLPKFKRITAISAQIVRQNTAAGRVRLTETLTQKDLAAHAGRDEIFYAVRARVERSSSDSSNVVELPILPVPQPVNDLRAQTTNNVVELTWSPPPILPQGSTAPSSLQYQIYRAGVLAANAQPSSPAENAAGASEFTLLAESPQPNYSDATAKPGENYRYMVRAIAQYAAGSVQSADSNVLEVTLSQNSRPAAPSNVIAAFVPANGPAGPYTALSWSISTESGITGYNVYRSAAQDSIGTRLNSAPVLTPVFEDHSITPGEMYFYRITAVNSAGNESEYSAPLEVKVPDSNQAPLFSNGFILCEAFDENLPLPA